MYILIYKEESGYDLKVEKLHGVDQVAVVSNIKIIHGLPGKLIKISNKEVSKLPEKEQYTYTQAFCTLKHNHMNFHNPSVSLKHLYRSGLFKDFVVEAV